jgi:hypothetical protein
MVAGMGNVFARGGPPFSVPPVNTPLIQTPVTTVTTIAAPEINAGAAGSAIALLVTGILIAAERRRRL